MQFDASVFNKFIDVDEEVTGGSTPPPRLCGWRGGANCHVVHMWLAGVHGVVRAEGCAKRVFSFCYL